MNKKQLISNIEKEVEKHLTCNAHGLDHVYRVTKIAKLIASHYEGVDMLEIEISALLHDIARVIEDTDETRQIDHAELGAKMAKNILQQYDELTPEFIDKIYHNIISHRIRNSHTPNTLAAKILYDADKIDIFGFIGVGRLITFGAPLNQGIYSDVDIDEYIKTNVNEKGKPIKLEKHTAYIEYLLKLKDLPDNLYTEVGRQVAKKRLKNVNYFFKTYKEELDCSDITKGEFYEDL